MSDSSLWREQSASVKREVRTISTGKDFQNKTKKKKKNTKGEQKKVSDY